MRRQTSGTDECPASEHTIINSTNISRFPLLNTFTSSTYQIWSSLRTFWWLGSGVRRWRSSRSLFGRITRLASGWRMGDQLLTNVLKWLGCTLILKLLTTIGLYLLGFRRKTTGSLTLCHDQIRQNAGADLSPLQVLWGQDQSRGRYHLKCSHFNVFAGIFAELRPHMEYVQQHAWADNTLKALSSEWKTFKVFCKN